MLQDTAPAADHVILIGFDGLRPDSVTPTDCPNLDRLLRRAAVMPNHRSVFPSETRTNLTSLVTGALTSEHGIVGNHFVLRDRDRPTPIDTSRAGDIEEVAHRRSGGRQAPEHVADLLARHGRTSAILSTGSEGSFALLSGYPNASGRVAFNPRRPDLTIPGTLRSALFPSHAADRRDDLPRCLADAFLDRIWPAWRPALSILWLVEADTASHDHGIGSPEHRAAIRQIDDQLGRLVDWRESVPERDRIAIAVLSDHGHVTIGGTVPLARSLTLAGFRVGPHWQDGVDLVLAPGLSPGLWARQADPTRLRDAVEALVEQPWCGPVLSDGTVPDTLSHADVMAAHPDSPDLRVTFRGDDGVNAFGVAGRSAAIDGVPSLIAGCGHHGGLQPAELACLFAVQGAAFVAGRHDTVWSRTADVMPTLLRALGIDEPARSGGRVISEALAGSSTVSERPRPDSLSVTAGGTTHTLRRVRVGSAVYLDGVQSRSNDAAEA